MADKERMMFVMGDYYARLKERGHIHTGHSITKVFIKAEELIEEFEEKDRYYSWVEIGTAFQLWLMKEYGCHTRDAKIFYTVVLNRAREDYEENKSQIEDYWNPKGYEFVEY